MDTPTNPTTPTQPAPPPWTNERPTTCVLCNQPSTWGELCRRCQLDEITEDDGPRW